MSSLKERLRADLTAAMKSRDELVKSTLRMTLTAVHTVEVAGEQAAWLLVGLASFVAVLFVIRDDRMLDALVAWLDKVGKAGNIAVSRLLGSCDGLLQAIGLSVSRTRGGAKLSELLCQGGHRSV